MFLTAECTQYWQFLLCQGFGIGVSPYRLCMYPIYEPNLYYNSDHQRSVLQYRKHGAHPLVQEEARLGTRNCVYWDKHLRMRRPRAHEGSAAAYEVLGLRSYLKLSFTYVTVHSSFKWAMRVLGFITLGLLVPTIVVRWCFYSICLVSADR